MIGGWGKQAVLRQNLSYTISNPMAVVDFTQIYLTYKFQSSLCNLVRVAVDIKCYGKINQRFFV